MYTKYITYSFLATTWPHVYDSRNITKQKKIEKIMQCPFIKFPPFLYGSDFFLKKDIIKEMQKKHTLFEWNFIQKLENFKLS